MDDLQIIIEAIKVEATLKPNEKLFIGPISVTYAELASKINGRKKDKLVESFMTHALKEFKSNPKFREVMMKLATGAKEK